MARHLALLICTAAAALVAAASPAGAASNAANPSCTAPAGSEPPQVASVAVDTRLREAWRAFGNDGGGWDNRRGWAAADGTYSTTLPGGDVAWLLNDTFLGPVNSDQSLPADAGFIHNSIVRAGRDGLPRTTITGGTQDAPESLVGDTPTAPPSDPSGTNAAWFWNGDGIVDGGRLRLIEFQQGPTDDPPPFNFDWTGTSIASFSHDLKLASVTPTYSQGNIQWGVELLRCAGWTYIYGAEPVPFDKQMHIARARAGHLVDGDWEFWTGSGWSRDPLASARVMRDVGSSYGVAPVDGHFVLVTSNATLGHDIYVATAPTPTGPWSARQKIYTAPEAGGNIYAPYNIAVHPEISRPGELVITYNVNSAVLADLYADADNNRARFLDLRFTK